LLDRPKFVSDVAPSGEDPSLMDFIERRGVEIIYDIGAKVGQFGTALRRRGYTGLIVSFEPRSSNYAGLVQIAAADGAWDCFHCALGSSSGRFPLNERLSSAGAAPEDLHGIDTQSTVRSEEIVDFQTLDWIVGTMRLFVYAPSLIKIDAPAFERDVLKGARRTLTKTAGILTPSPLDDVSGRSWSFSEAEQYVAKLGFSPVHPSAALRAEWLFLQQESEAGLH
jgi:FkbM family methyltransferase